VLDLPQLSAFARRHGVLLAVDNTWGAGLLYQPLALGADLSIQAVTKYLSGHSDLMQGAIAIKDAQLAQRIAQTHEALGLSVGADDAYLALRGVRTLAVRLAQHAAHAFQVAQYLALHPAIGRVFHPALPHDPGHALWLRDFKGSNGLVSFAFRQGSSTAVAAFVDALKLFGLGASWGGYESLVLPAPAARLAGQSYWQGSQPVVRLHIGLEDPDDLLEDLEQGLRLSVA